MSQCQFIKSDGQECMANAMKDCQFCFTHNPATKFERQIALSKGGSAPKRASGPLPKVKLETAKDVANLLSVTISEVRAGVIELRTANCIGYLSGHLLKAFDVSDLEIRLSSIERTLSS